MNNYKPSTPFTVPMKLLIPTTIKEKGVLTKKYNEAGLIYGSFRTFGGTESVENGVLSVTDTATIETWYRPDIKSDCAIETEDGNRYEIIGTPENINMRNQYMKFKVVSVKGGA